VRAESSLAELKDQNAKLRKALEDAGLSLADLQKRFGSVEFGPLDQQTDEALRQLAAQYPDLIKYDPDRGMLRFASDLTFDSGSAVVKDTARSSLDALAKILNSGPASAYEVHIVGHTDSQRISSNTAKQHPTNVHLSCHRAISVRQELASMGVPPDKLLAAGWGEYRPAVPNNANGNTPQNRRVEIFLARSTATGLTTPIEPTTTRAQPERTAAPTRQPEVTK
jgi:chemotaxis protein MotB